MDDSQTQLEMILSGEFELILPLHNGKECDDRAFLRNSCFRLMDGTWSKCVTIPALSERVKEIKRHDCIVRESGSLVHYRVRGFPVPADGLDVDAGYVYGKFKMPKTKASKDVAEHAID